MNAQVSTLLLAALLGLAQCKKHDPSPEAQLPPATQTGANTFGCLLNGQPWGPSGFNGVDNYRLTYDPAYHGGSLQVRVYRYVPALQDNQYLLIGGSPISKTGVYPIDGTVCGVYYNAGAGQACREYYQAPGLRMRGQFTVTRLDMTSGIISGTFAFTLTQPGCDSIRVTQGRFDKKL